MKVEEKLLIFSTCTLQKRSKAPEDLHLSSIGDLSAQEASKRWSLRLQSSSEPRVEAKDLYLGSHWKETQATFTNAQALDLNPELWVLSAGYGLIPASKLIPAYGASFSSGDDSIQNLKWPASLTKSDRSRKWWDWLHQGDKQEGLSRFRQKEYSNSTLLFILSPGYYDAIEHELLKLIGIGRNVLIVSAGLYRRRNQAAPLARPHILPFSDRFKKVDPYLNKANVSLNACLANWLVQRYPHKLKKGADLLTSMLGEIASSVPNPERKPINRMSDDEVLIYIAEHFDQQHDSATKLLRKLRHEANLSCEQKRFGALFRQFSESQQPNFFNNE